MLTKRRMTIALVGDHPSITDWKSDLVVAFMKLHGKHPDESLDVDFTQTVNPALAPFVSVGSLGAQTVDLILCREQLLSSLADITVMIDSGISNETLVNHSKRLEERSSAVIYWSPTEDAVTVKPPPRDEIGLRPGSMYLDCSLDFLASCLYFLCVSDEALVLGEE